MNKCLHWVVVHTGGEQILACAISILQSISYFGGNPLVIGLTGSVL